MHSPFSVYKALVVSSSASSGTVYIKIPALLGNNETIAVSTMNLNKTSTGWVVPAEGSRVLVVVEDSEMTNVYLLNPPPEPLPPPEPPEPPEPPTVTIPEYLFVPITMIFR